MRDSEKHIINRIAADLHTLGIFPGEVLLVHSSLKSLGKVPGGADTVIRGLLSALGPEGTLMMPALSYEIVTSDHPEFDLRETPSNVGSLPEYFRRQPGSLRSVHPTHSVCAKGRHAHSLTAQHEEDLTPCGPHSPFHRLPEYRGKILMLGCGLRPNTSMHAVEELVEPPYLFGKEVTYRISLPHQEPYTRTYRTHGFSGWGQRYERVQDVLDGVRTEEGKPALREGHVLEAKVFLIDADCMWRHVFRKMREAPLYFVEKTPE